MLSLITGSRTKWLVALLWLGVVVAAGPVQSKFQAGQKNDPSSFLPGGSESVRVLRDVREISGGNAITPAVVVYHRQTGLTAADRAAINRDRAILNMRLPRAGVPSPPLRLSPDRRAGLLVFGLRLGDSAVALNRQVGEIRRVAHASVGLDPKVTGPAGISYDAGKVFGSIDGTLLVVTVGLIFVLLIIIYRSPVFWAIPLVSVIFAEAAARGLGYVLEQAGVTINGQTGGILTVLVFGAGTDYALLLVARYREELRRHPDRHEAMAVALRRAGPTIIASGTTVICALLCLLAAQVNGTRGFGPVGAIGIALAMLSSLTLLPALLVICGRRAFWPFTPQYQDTLAAEGHRAWQRIAAVVRDHRRPISVVSVLALGVLCLGALSYNTHLTNGNSFRGRVESQQGQQLIAAHFPAGASAPADVIVGDRARVAAVRAKLAAAPGVARGPGALRPVRYGRPGAYFTVTIAADPSSEQAFSIIASLRHAARSAGGPSTLIGGATAQELDLRTASARDNTVILPIVVLAVFVILALLLRALVAPALLVATVLLTFAAALGTGTFLFNHVFGYPGEDPSLLLYAFIFLVALGVDYNIFLMARAREETLHSNTSRGTLHALTVTGAVITSAGVVLAGTFAALASLPLITFTEIGFIIAFGVLLDTFLVRTILVPALVLDLDRRVWWPSALSRRPPTRPPSRD